MLITKEKTTSNLVKIEQFSKKYTPDKYYYFFVKELELRKYLQQIQDEHDPDDIRACIDLLINKESPGGGNPRAIFAIINRVVLKFKDTTKIYR